MEAAKADYCSIEIDVITSASVAQSIRIYNVYNLSPISTTSRNSPFTLFKLAEGLRSGRVKSTHLVVEDFNLHHPYWGGGSCLIQHAMADTLIELTAETHLNLLLPTGEITKRINQQRTTIDLAFTQQWITKKLIQYGVRKNLYYNSDHLPILTEISLKVIREISISRRA